MLKGDDDNTDDPFECMMVRDELQRSGKTGAVPELCPNLFQYLFIYLFIYGEDFLYPKLAFELAM